MTTKEIRGENMQNHTPTPWEVGKYGRVQAESSSGPLSSIVVSGFTLTGGVEAESNARHIVKCVNYHDRLVAALDDCVQHLDCADGFVARQLLAELSAHNGGEG